MTAQHGTHNKYTCDFICNCPANDTAERVEREVLTTLREGVEGLSAEYCERRHSVGMSSCDSCDGEQTAYDKVLALIEKAGE